MHHQNISSVHTGVPIPSILTDQENVNALSDTLPFRPPPSLIPSLIPDGLYQTRAAPQPIHQATSSQPAPSRAVSASLGGPNLCDRERQRVRFDYLHLGLEAVDVLGLELDKLRESQASLPLRLKHIMNKVSHFEAEREELQTRLEAAQALLVEEFERRAEQLQSEYDDYLAPNEEALALLREHLAEVVEGRCVEIIALSELANPAFRSYLAKRAPGSVSGSAPGPGPSASPRTSFASGASYSPRGTPLSLSAVSDAVRSFREKLTQNSQHGKPMSGSRHSQKSASPSSSSTIAPSLPFALASLPSPVIPSLAQSASSFGAVPSAAPGRQWRSLGAGSNLTPTTDLETFLSLGTHVPPHAPASASAPAAQTAPPPVSALAASSSVPTRALPEPLSRTTAGGVGAEVSGANREAAESTLVQRRQKAIDTLIPLFPHLSLLEAMRLLQLHSDNLERCMMSIIDEEIDSVSHPRSTAAHSHARRLSNSSTISISSAPSDASSQILQSHPAAAPVAPTPELERMVASLARAGVLSSYAFGSDGPHSTVRSNASAAVAVVPPSSIAPGLSNLVPSGSSPVAAAASARSPSAVCGNHAPYSHASQVSHQQPAHVHGYITPPANGHSTSAIAGATLSVRSPSAILPLVAGPVRGSSSRVPQSPGNFCAMIALMASLYLVREM